MLHTICRSGVSALYDISYLWSGPGGALITVIVAFIVSIITGELSSPIVSIITG